MAVARGLIILQVVLTQRSNTFELDISKERQDKEMLKYQILPVPPSPTTPSALILDAVKRSTDESKPRVLG